jgi:TonB family protein
MSAGESAHRTSRPQGTADGRTAALKLERRRFWLAVALVAMVHAGLIVGVGRSSAPALRYMGDKGGQPEGISVELVDAADFESKSSIAPEPAGQPGAPAETPPPAAPPPEEPAPQQEPPPAPAETRPKTTTSAIEQPKFDLPAELGPLLKPKTGAPAAKQAKEPREPKEPKEKLPPVLERDPLQWTMPAVPQYVPGGRAAAWTRPAGITRSGENDDFGRGVIRALQRTMPSSDRLGRVTIRLVLNERGNVQSVELVRSGGDPLMDQNVVFAARQSSFPLPPVGATLADRSFLVTYVYQ